MHDTRKTKARLIEELQELREQVARLEGGRRNRERAAETAGKEEVLQAIEAMPDPLILLGMDGRFLFINRAHESMSGYKKEEVRGRHFSEFLQEAIREEELEEIGHVTDAAFGAEGTPPLEFTFVTKKGREVPLSARASFVNNEKGEPAGIVVTFRDLTESKRAESQLRESEQRFQALFEGSLDAIFVFDPESGVILDANPVSSELLKKPLRDIIGMHHAELTPPRLRERAKATFQAHIEERGPSEPYETTLVTSEGTEVPVELLAQIIQLDGVPVLLGTFRDLSQRRRAEEALLQSEERYRLLVQNSSDIVAMFDSDLLVRYASPAAERILGYRPEELAGQPAISVLHAEDHQTVARDLLTCLNNPDESVTAQYRFRHKDGSWKILESVASNCLQNPAIRALIVNSRDITERKRLEEELQKSEERYRLLAENSPDIITIINPDNTFRYISPAAEPILGYTPEEVIENMGFDFVHPEDRAATVAAFSRVLESPDKLMTHSYRLRHKDGSWKHVEAVAKNCLANPAMRAVVLNIRDISERKRLEKTLERSQSRYRFLYENLRDGSTTVNLDGKITECNTTFQDMLGHTAEELHRLGFRQITPPTWHALEDRIIREQVMTRGYSDIYEKEYFRKDGTVLPVEIRTHLLRDEEGKPAGRWSVIRDISERKRMEQELLKTEKLESLGVLCGGIAHDFNNILTAVLTNISMAQMYGALDEETGKMLADAEKASLRAQGLTQQLLTFAKGGDPVKKILQVPRLIRDTVDFALSGSNVKCEYAFAEDLWLVEADEGQIGQVIQNVILNADQAMPGGGVLRVRAENANVAGENHMPPRPGPHVRISITDQGIGIPPKHLKKVFDPFFTTKQKGSGLGLSTSFSIVKRHNGALRIESRLGEGTSVHIYLPALTEMRVPEERSTIGLYRGEGRVLLVDDDATLRRSIGRALGRLGYEVHLAEDGAQGIALYEEAVSSGRPVDVVVMDLTIPGGMGGKETARELLRVDPGAKIVVSSGYSTDPVMSDFRAHGFRAVISKPYRIEDLGETLRKVLTDD